MPETLTITPLERAARAMHASRKSPERHRWMPWEELPKDIQQEWLDLTRAVLQAIREPNEVMLKAGAGADSEGGTCGNPREIWDSMIDAALAAS